MTWCATRADAVLPDSCRPPVPIAALEQFVRTAALIYARFSKSGAAASLGCFDGLALMQGETEKRHYLNARLEAIRTAYRVEFLSRVPPFHSRKFEGKRK
jgi:hypothetical protein